MLQAAKGRRQEAALRQRVSATLGSHVATERMGGGRRTSKVKHKTTLNGKDSLRREREREPTGIPGAKSLREGHGGAHAQPEPLRGARLPLLAPTGTQ